MESTGDMQETGAETTDATEAQAPAVDLSSIDARFDKLEGSLESIVEAARPQQREESFDDYDDYYEDEAPSGYDPYGDRQQAQGQQQQDGQQFGPDGQPLYSERQVQQMIAQQVGPVQSATQQLAFRQNLADLASEFPELDGKNPEAIEGFTKAWQQHAQEMGLSQSAARSYPFMRQVQLARVGEQLLAQGAGQKQEGTDVIEGGGGPGGQPVQSDEDYANAIVNAGRKVSLY